MKILDFERHLKICGCFKVREGGSHSIWENPKNSISTSVPRHKEISNILCKKICKQLAISMPEKF